MENTKQQKRAKFALEKISEFKGADGHEGLSPKDFHELANFIVSMPNMVLSNGLGQTLVYLLTKKDKQRKAFNIIKEWILRPENKFELVSGNDMDFLQSISEIDPKKYLEIQNETLRLMEWLKRYARAFDEYEE